MSRFTERKNIMIRTGSRLSIRLDIAIILMFVILIFGTAGLIGIISFRNGLKAIDEVAERMMDSIQSRVSEAFDAFLAQPHAINRLNADAFHSGQIDIRDFPRIRQRFLSQIQAFDSVETCAFGSAAGEFISAGKRGSGKFDSAIADKMLDNHYRVHLLDETGNPGEMVTMVQNYHPQPRPWYQEGLAANGPAWSPVYVWASQTNIGISAVLSVRDKSGTVIGVQQSALSLSHIEEFLQTFRKGKPGQVFVMERSGFMIASSIPGTVVRKNPAGHEKPVGRIQALESDDPLIRDTSMHIKAHFADFEKIVERQKMRIELDGKTHFLSLAPYRDNRGLNWIVCVAIPESDLIGPVQTNLFTTLYAGLIALLVSIALTFLFTRRLTRPLVQLTESANRMRQGVWGNISEDIRIAEVRLLAVAFNEMANQLAGAFQTLEERVKTRTNDLIQVNAHLETEILERKQIEEALKKSESVLKSVLSATADGILAVGSNNQVLYANGRFADMWGIPQDILDNGEDDLLLKHVQDQLVDPEYFLNEVCRLYKSDKESFDTLIFRDGRIFERLSQGMILNNVVHGRVWSFRDVSEHKRAEGERAELERRLMQARKAESLARMAEAIAHHFNNLMTAVIGNLELAMMSVPPDSPIRHNLIEAMNAARRSADLGGHMLSYLGQSISTRTPIVLTDVCREAVRHIQAILPENILIRIDMAETHPVVHGNAEQIRQVVTNVMTNAVESIGNRPGEIVVTVGVRTSAEMTHARFHPQDWNPNDMHYACISVRDTGPGMDTDTLEKVFDPFFSTRFTGRGLGLPVSLGIVRAHNGAISVESEPDKGSQLNMYLPLLNDKPQLFREIKPAAQPSDTNQKRILVVDDEPMVRKMAQTMLTYFGHEVIPAVDGHEAIRIYKEKQDSIDCVLLDLTMPGMDGWETLAALRRIRPNVPVILTSGNNEASVMGAGHAECPHVFLHKPYQMADLKAALSHAWADTAHET